MPRGIAIALTLLALRPWAARALERVELPPKDGALVRVGNTAKFWEQLSALYVGPLLKDARLHAFTTAMDEKLKTMASEGKIPLLSQMLRAQLPVFQGELVYSFRGGNGPTNNWVYIATEASRDEYLEMLERDEWSRARLGAPGATIQSEFAGETVRETITERDGKSHSFWNVHVKDTALASNDKEWLEKTILRLQQEETTTSAVTDLIARVPLKQFIRGSLLNTPPEQRAAKTGWYDALGLLGVGDIAAGAKFSGNRLCISTTIQVSDLAKGIFSLIDTTPGAHSTPGLIAPDAASFCVGRINLRAFWRQLPTILMAAPPNISGKVGPAILLFQRETGVNIETDLLANLSNEMHFFSTRTSPTNHFPQLALGLSDATAMEASLARLLAAPLIARTGVIEASEYRGHTMHSLKTNDPGANPTSLCVVQDQLLVGGRAQLRDTISRLEAPAPAATSALLAKAENIAEGHAFGLGGTNHKQAESLLALNMSDSSFSLGLGFGKQKADKDGKEELGENEISLDYISSFLSSSYSYTETVPEGIHHVIIFDHIVNQGAP